MKAFWKCIGFMALFPMIFSCIGTAEDNPSGSETIETNQETVEMDNNWEEDWTMIWNDEFDGETLDPTKWNLVTGNGFFAGDQWVSGWGNGELEYYTDREENLLLEDGKLIIQALEDNYRGEAGGAMEDFQYTSGKLTTEGLAQWTNGRYEIRAKLPRGRGFWPAFWLYPEENTYGGWAASGEIDILEAWGSDPTKVSGALHFGGQWPNNKHTANSYWLPPGQTTSQWHTYALEWEPGEIRWYVDDKLMQTQNRWSSGNIMEPEPYPAPFDHDFFLILNLAVGGHFDGNPDRDTPFPSRYEIDYVRVYELTGRPYREAVKPEVDMDIRPDHARKALMDGNDVYNSAFDMDDPNVEGIEGVPGSDYWTFLDLETFGGDGELSIETIDLIRYARLDITEPGNKPYSIQLIQYLPIIKGHRYRLSFDSFAAAPREFQMKINGDEDNSWATYSNVETVELTTEPQTFVYYFIMEEETDPEARLEFNTGLNSSTTWIGNIRLEDMDG
ncbi:MAG: family 16 glycosylhydrolase [Spirochaetaceae bacterium]|nr:family 16 glycosylhydrolase [Spirochaetaceae bacterium]